MARAAKDKSSKKSQNPPPNKRDTEAKVNDESPTPSTKALPKDSQPRSGKRSTTAKTSTSKRKSDPGESVEETTNKKKRTRAHSEDVPRMSLRTLIATAIDDNKINDVDPGDKYMGQILEIAIRYCNDKSVGGAQRAGLEPIDQASSDRIAKHEKEKEDLKAQAKSTALRLKETKEALDIAKSKLEKSTEENETLESQVKEQHKAVQDAQFSAKQKAEESKRYHAGNLALVRENNELDEENIKLQDEVRQLREEICDIGNKLADKNLDYVKTCDSTIIEDWNYLFYLVRQAVANHMQSPPLVEREMIWRQNEYADDILHLSQDTKNLSPGYQMYAFQRYIWNRLYSDLFEGHKAIWAGPAAEAVLTFSQRLGEVAAYHLKGAELLSEIKSNTAHQVDGRFGIDDSSLERYIDSFARDLEYFVTRDNLDMTFRNRMSEIIYLADKLRVAMMKSKAFFHISWTPYAGRTVASTRASGEVNVCFWEAVPEHQEPMILHVVAPELWKRGLADGRGFEHTTLLVNAVVVASDPRTEEEMQQAEREIEQTDTESSDEDEEENSDVQAEENVSEGADEDGDEQLESSYEDSGSCTANE